MKTQGTITSVRLKTIRKKDEDGRVIRGRESSQSFNQNLS
jgi:hypothetical protein